MGGRDISVNSCSHTAWFQEGELLVVGVDGYILSEVSSKFRISMILIIVRFDPG